MIAQFRDAFWAWVLFGAMAIWLSSCASPESNLARLEAECALAPLAELGATLIPVPGSAGILALSLGAICANTSLIAENEAALATALAALRKKL